VARVVEFTHEGHNYRAEIRPVPDGGVEFRDGAWFVTVDDGPPRRVFEVQAGDDDSPAFRHRLMIGAWLAEGWDRRSGTDRRKRGARLGAHDRRQNSFTSPSNPSGSRAT
jgi:hypothetical protein